MLVIGSRFLCLFLLTLCLVFDTGAQTKTEARLLEKLRTEKSDTAKVSLYLQLAEISERELADEYLQRALMLSKQIGYHRGTSKSYARMGTLSRNESQYFQAIELYKLAIGAASPEDTTYLDQTYLELGIAHLRLANLDSAEQALSWVLEVGNDYLKASAYNMLGNVEKERANYQKAVENYLKATKLFRLVNDKSGLTQSISNLGNVQVQLGNLKSAMEYAKESLTLAQQSNQMSSIAYSYRLIGRIFRNEQKLDSAIIFYDKALSLYKELGLKGDVGETYINIGNIHFEKLDFNKAIEFYKQAVASAKTITDSINLAYAYSSIGQAYLEMGRNNLSDQFMDSAHWIAVPKKLHYVELDVLYTRSWNHAGRKRFDLALEAYRSYTSLKDSIANNENRLAAEELEQKYQYERKEEQIRVLNAENEIARLQLRQKNTQRNYFIGLTVLSLLLIVVLYSRYRIKRKTAKDLAALDKIKSRFITNLSHEFRTPLTLIAGPLSRRIEKVTDPDEREELEVMARNAHRLSTMIDQLLDLAKLESGNMKLQWEAVDLNEMFRLIFASFQSLAENKQIDFKIDVNLPETEIYIDRDKIEKVVINLLSNAFKYTPSGGSISIAASVENKQLHLAVTDSGIGIAKEQQALIFDRFYQIDQESNRKAEGTGIGLALCKELIDLHKGKLTVYSEKGIGATFSFTVPIRKEAYRNGEKTETVAKEMLFVDRPSHDQGAFNFAPKIDEEASLILVAEDNIDMRKFIERTLSENYQVITAPNGREAFDKASTVVPDLIITDVMMPEMDGVEFCALLRAEVSTSHIPVIMLTAKADLDSKIKGLAEGADDYLTKPFDSRELLVRVGNLIQQRKRLQEIFRKQVIVEPKQLNEANPTERFLSDLLKIVEDRYADGLFGVEELAASLSMSRSQLHRKLKAITGDSPGDFLRHYRLERAKQLFRAGGYQVAEVAYQTGFNNVPNFTKAFKDYTGITPSAYLAGESETT